MIASLSPNADVDLMDVLRYTEREFGRPARQRYLELIRQSLKDVASIEPTEMEQLTVLGQTMFIYHLRRSCLNVPASIGRVGRPRHVLVCRRTTNGVEVIRILHDRADPERWV
jgi:toxin ParE1/3/4